MEQLKVRIQSLEDAANGFPAIQELTPENIRETKDITVCFLEGGTVGGQTSVMIALKNEDGTYSVGELTANHFHSLYAAFQGAEQRFIEQKNDGSK